MLKIPEPRTWASCFCHAEVLELESLMNLSFIVPSNRNLSDHCLVETMPKVMHLMSLDLHFISFSSFHYHHL